VVGVDGSSSARAALRWALKRARLTGARAACIAAVTSFAPRPSTVLS
jgi:nucleotide-binding universal stress UspA family protein